MIQIYKIVLVPSTIIYIGKTSMSLQDRWHKNKISNGLRGKYTGCDSPRSRNICVNKSSAA